MKKKDEKTSAIFNPENAYGFTCTVFDNVNNKLL